jgi:excisionase family DNA binding protein
MTGAHPDRDDVDRGHHQLMTVVEVAAALRVSKATVYRMVQSGVMPSKRMGRTVRISRRIVEDFLGDDVVDA